MTMTKFWTVTGILMFAAMAVAAPRYGPVDDAALHVLMDPCKEFGCLKKGDEKGDEYARHVPAGEDSGMVDKGASLITAGREEICQDEDNKDWPMCR